MSLSDTPEILVNGRKISAPSIDAEMQYHPAETRRQAMIEAAETLIIGELLKQQAEVLGVINTEVTLDKDEEQLLVEQLLLQEVVVPQATDDECYQYYSANQNKFVTSPLLEVRHILVGADPQDLDARAEGKQLAETLVVQLKRSPDQFAELAALHSNCPSAQTGGQLGQLSHGQTVPEFQRQVFAAKEGLMTTPVESRFGYHVVEVVRKIPGNALPYDMVKERISDYLEEKVQRKATAQYLQQLISTAEIEGFDFNIEASALLQ